MNDNSGAQPTITIVYNTAFYVYKFRMNLIAALKNAGYKVAVISPHDDYVSILQAHDIEHYPIRMSQYGMNPLKELVTAFAIYRVLNNIKPKYSLHYTIKPNIFGSLAANWAGVPVINNIAGAGKAFSNEGSLLQRLAAFLYRISLRRSHKVFFQNRDDMKLFLDGGLAPASISERIPGSGVDLTKYAVPLPQNATRFRFLFVGRLLKEKGICEYLQAASRVLQQHPERSISFEIVGELDDTADYVDREYFESFLQNPSFVYHGTVSPNVMPQIIGMADCVVLPSYYREGVPRSLLEAAAMAKPIITTDNVGCRDVLENSVNGFKCSPRDADDLYDCMRRMLELPVEERLRMGANGRRKAETQFDEKLVLAAYLRAISPQSP